VVVGVWGGVGVLVWVSGEEVGGVLEVVFNLLHFY